jgi:hypothetical protein
MGFQNTSNREAGRVRSAANLPLASMRAIAAIAFLLVGAFGSTAVSASVRSHECGSRNDTIVPDTCEIRHLAVCPSWGIAEAYWDHASVQEQSCLRIHRPGHKDNRDDRDWRQLRWPRVA